MTFIPEGLARPPAEVLDAMVIALWERQHDRMDQRIRGAVEAGQWLAQVRRCGPVSGEDRAPVAEAVVDELDVARAVVFGLPHAPRHVEPEYADGVARMLAYATDPAAPRPVDMVHTTPPPKVG